MSYQNLLLTREDATLMITLNRPAQMNAGVDPVGSVGSVAQKVKVERIG